MKLGSKVVGGPDSPAETPSTLDGPPSMNRGNAGRSKEATRQVAPSAKAVHRAGQSKEQVIEAGDGISSPGQEIRAIIESINEIALQTSLMALDVPVEAGRYGEAGAAFAERAEEIRNLAIRSAEAVRHAADLISSTTAYIQSGSELVDSPDHNFKMVEDSASLVAGLLMEMAAAREELSRAVEHTNLPENRMDRTTQTKAASAQVAAGLLDQTGTLLGAVIKLREVVEGQSQGIRLKVNPCGAQRP